MAIPEDGNEIANMQSKDRKGQYAFGQLEGKTCVKGEEKTTTAWVLGERSSQIDK